MTNIGMIKTKLSQAINTTLPPRFVVLPLFTKQTCVNISRWYTKVLTEKLEEKGD